MCSDKNSQATDLGSMFELNMFHHITFHVLSSSAGLSMAITQSRVDSFHSAVRSELGMFGEDCTAFYSIYYYSENDAVCACIQQAWRMLRRDEWKIIFTVQSMILYQEYPDNLFSWTLNDIPIVTSGESAVTRKLTGLGI